MLKKCKLQNEGCLIVDEKYIKMAIELAGQGRGYTAPNPMVGAVIVKAGVVVGKGYHEQAGGPHAEINAIADACGRADGATLYVSLEPCNHHGRTPPCTEAIIQSGIRRVVVGMEDPNPDVRGGGIQFLKDHGIDVISGVLRDESERLNEFFVKYVSTKRPFVILKCACTLDGSIATRTGDSKWITNEQSRGFVHELRHAVDAIMVGIGTVDKDNPRLTTRVENKQGCDPIRIILDSRLSISPDAHLLNIVSDSDTVIVTGPDVPEEKRRQLTARGVRILSTQLKDGQIDIDILMTRLGEMGITSLLIEGGSRVNASAIRAGIVDKIYLFYAPKILGANDGIPVFAGKGPALMSESLRIKDVTVHRFEDDVMIKGYLK
jgi:diaminohydroxyphosphoribosylaminopyrimidine deaminase/5-amino-6-(5-phosphoribosylamino)uracil reductase